MARLAHLGLEATAWGFLSLVAAVGWFATARGLAFRWGLGEAAGGIGIAAAIGVVVVLWSWRSRDRALEALEGGACPRCRSTVTSQHQHGEQGRRGVAWWECTSCGYARSESLTCERCAA